MASAVELMHRFPEVIPEEQVPRLGIGLNAGLAYVGKVGEGEVSDFTALGDTVNTASRLQNEAKPGEIIVSDELYQAAEINHHNIEERILHFRGRKQPVAVRVLKFDDPESRNGPLEDGASSSY